MAGVCEREATVRDEAVSARPRVWLGSREADEGFSIWCDAFPAAGRACRRGNADMAPTSRAASSGVSEEGCRWSGCGLVGMARCRCRRCRRRRRRRAKGWLSPSDRRLERERLLSTC